MNLFKSLACAAAALVLVLPTAVSAAESRVADAAELARDADGKVTTWGFEAEGPSTLTRAAFARAIYMFRNPHAWVHVMAPDDKGVMQRWGVEWGGAGALTGQGVTRDSLKPGDHVVITGNPGRNASDHRVRMRSLLRPSDGFGWGFQGETFD